ncbi:MAG: SPASM domain-containing protein [Methanothrix sp.]|nr:SPASM domain-containing protein [Methanothrix sp.]
MRVGSLSANVKGLGKKMVHMVRKQVYLRTAHSQMAGQVARFAYQAFDPATDLFQEIMLQTHNLCNYACTFCPNRDVSRPRHQMSVPLFNRIISNLSRLQYEGSVLLSMQNEPLMDRRLFSFIEIAGAMLPRAKLVLHTNTSLLTTAKLERLTAAGVRCILNIYREEDRGNFSIGDLPPRLRRHVVIYDKTSWSATTAYLLNWAGNASKMPVPQRPLAAFCPRPFTMLCITPRGKALLCCLDWRHEWIMGDLAEDTLEDVWAGERFQKFRLKLLNGDRSDALCSKCNKDWSPMPWRLLCRRASACLSRRTHAPHVAGSRSRAGSRS